jgi:hypothetical protein
MKIKTNFIILTFLVLTSMLIPFISAVKPTPIAGLTSAGVQISYPSPYYLTVNNNLSIRFWVYNTTTGDTITNVSANCTYNLLDSSGRNILRVATPASSGIKFGGLGTSACANCFNLEINAANFTKTGYYSYQIRCDTGLTGGYLIGDYEAIPTRNGADNTTFFVILILIAAGLVLLGFIFENYIFAFFGGLAFLITGVYGMIYGYGSTTNLYTQMISYILIGLGGLITILSGLDLLGSVEGKDGGDD